MTSPFRQQFLCAIFLPDAARANELDLHTRCRSHPFGVLANPFAIRFGELRIIENPHLMSVQKRGHPSRVADPRQRAEYQ
jgi:hypothetical protein